MRTRDLGTLSLLTLVVGLLLVVALTGAYAQAEDATADVQKASQKLLEYRTEEARAALEPVIARANVDGIVAIALGRVLEQEKKYDDAAKTLANAGQLLPGNPAPQYFLGETYVHAKRFVDAEKAFAATARLAQSAVEKNASDAAAWYYLGAAQQRTKKYDKAFESLGKAKDAGYDGTLVLHQQGVTRVLEGKWQEAVDLLTRALDTNSGLAYAYYYRGLAQDKLGKKDQLVLDMDRFLKLAPKAPEADKAQAIVKAAKR